MNLPPPLLRIAYRILSLYWRTVRPKTHGVAILLLSRERPDHVLLVRHSYGNRRWTLPSGGYKPKREPAIAAACRELGEELGLALREESLTPLGEYKTAAEGKRDTARIFSVTIAEAEASIMSSELEALAWVDRESLFLRQDIGRIVGTGLRQLAGENRLEDHTDPAKPVTS